MPEAESDWTRSSPVSVVSTSAGVVTSGAAARSEGRRAGASSDLNQTPTREVSPMKVVVIGGTGLIGSKLVEKLNAHGHDASPAAPSTGCNTLTNEGVDEAVAGAEVLIDVSNSPSFADEDVMSFFVT